MMIMSNMRTAITTATITPVLSVSGWTLPTKDRILHECSCLIEFIKRVGEKLIN